MNNKYLVVITGATAVGKTALSLQLASHFNTHIISADSRQFFKETNIGTAKPTTNELAQVPHHFVSHLSILDAYSVGDYERDALQLLAQLFEKQDIVFLCGGSGLYIKAVCSGFDFFPDIALAVREQIQQNYAEKGLEYLQNEVKEKDPEYFAEVDIQNPQRLMRALEVCIGTQKPYSSFKNKRPNAKTQRPFSIIKVALDLPRAILYERINARVEDMMHNGLLNEAYNLYEHRHLNALQTVGYTELFRFFDAELTLPQAVELIKQNTRHYAKRQYTWLRKETDLQWFAKENETDILPFLQKKCGIF